MQLYRLCVSLSEFPSQYRHKLDQSRIVVFGNELLASGENPMVASERLGHSTIVLTLDTHSHLLPDMQAQAAEKIETLLFKTGS